MICADRFIRAVPRDRRLDIEDALADYNGQIGKIESQSRRRQEEEEVKIRLPRSPFAPASGHAFDERMINEISH